jgi:sulfatase modifying factor 1
MRRAPLALLALVLAACSRAPEQRPGMIYIPASEFPMGSRADDVRIYPWEQPKEQPQHPVFVNAFYLDVHEVTNKEFETWRFHARNQERSPCDECPVTDVSWEDAKAYCEEHKKRLPTEAEWEKAAKGGHDDPPMTVEQYDAYLAEHAWYAKNTITRAQPIMQKKPNDYGLYDMLGNVREWTGDWFDKDYFQQKVRDNPKGPATGERRVERGGAFFLTARGVTTTIRYNHPPTFHLYFLGFRCAQDV